MSAEDDQEIAKAARDRAQKLLDRLNNVQVKNKSEEAVKTKLKQRIVMAHKTIANPATRKKYLIGLAAKGSKGDAQNSLAAAPPTQVAAPTPTPTPTPTPAVAPTIPQAIPLAMPIESAPPQIAATSANDDPFANVVTDESLRVRPVRGRRKRGSIIPLLATLIVVAVIGGLISLLVKYDNVNDLISTVTTNTTTPVTPTKEDVEVDSNATEAETPTVPLAVPKNFKSLAATQQKQLDDMAPDAPKRSEDQDAALKRSREKRRERNAKRKKARQADLNGSTKPDMDAMGDDSDINPFDEPDPQDDMTKSNMRHTTTKDTDDNSEAFSVDSELTNLEPTEDSSVSYVTVNMVRFALTRRDIPAAKTANMRVNHLAGQEFIDADTKSLLKKEHALNEQMIDHLDVFLNQLRSSAKELPAGEEVEVGTLIMALVDSSPTDVTFRRAGRNDVIPFTDLPTSVAIALGDQGAIKSIPRWNMAKAADLIIQSEHNSSLKEKARPFLDQSISDGYDEDCQAISAYSGSVWKHQAVAESLPADPTVEEVDSQMREFRTASQYKDPRKVASKEASTLIEKLLFLPAPEPEQRLARLSEAIAIAAQQRNFDAVLIATTELYRISDPVNVTDTLVKPIRLCMRGDMTAAQARHLVHIIIALLRHHSDRQQFNKKAKPDLLRHAQTLVEEFKFSELAPKVKQFAN